MLSSRQRHSEYVKNPMKASAGQARSQQSATGSARSFRALRQPARVAVCRRALFFAGSSFDGEEWV